MYVNLFEVCLQIGLFFPNFLISLREVQCMFLVPDLELSLVDKIGVSPFEELNDTERK